MIDNQQLSQLRALPIEAVAERLGLTVVRHKTLCPFHPDKHPSLTFDRKSNTYHCWACGSKGNNIDLVMHLLKLPFTEACRWLDDGHNVIISMTPQQPAAETCHPFDAARYERYLQRPWLSPSALCFLYAERHLDERVVRWCGLSSYTDRHNTDWLTIPYRDTEGHLIGIQYRRLTPSETAPRFRFPRDCHTSIYNLPVLNRLADHDELCIAEGPSDTWALLSAGHRAIAIPSATTLRMADRDLLKRLASERHVRFVMWPDADAPGRQLAEQLSSFLPIELRELPAGIKDFGQWYAGR